ncbi:MAG: hypothetical protein JNG83_14770 [Opitutaceae bacterium]|nr:hypothetical protein [Opitutaceae bacterium]
MTNIGLIEIFTNWWESLNGARQLFYGIGLFAGLISLVLAAMAIIGMEHHDAVDAVGSADLNHGGGGIFSIKPLTGFFLGFGSAGGLALDAGLSLPAAVLVAVVAGSVVMAIIVVMIRTIYGFRSDGTRRIQDSVGAVGTVYITVPPRKASGGQVVVNFSGRQETLEALSVAERPIASGEKVRVTGVVDGRTVSIEPV